MKALIVNADDFGMTAGVNRGILETHQRGIVTSTTLLANGAAFAEAVAASGENPRLAIGVHLNLSEGAPVSLAAKIPTLVNSQGRLHLTPGKLRMAMLAGRVRSADIETELRAQVAKVMEAGIAPTHLDGHMHVHVLRGISEAAIKIAREFRIPAVRCPIEPVGNLRSPGSGESLTTRRLISLAVSWNARRLRRLLRHAGLLYPARFYGTFATGYLDAQVLSRMLHAVPEISGVGELMCHPGYNDAELPQVGGSLQHQRETERAALTAPEIVKQIAGEQIQLVTYRDLTDRTRPLTARAR